MKDTKKKLEREKRQKKANELLSVIASCGRRFFHHDGMHSCFIMDERDRLWFWEAWTDKLIYTHHPWTKWERRGFHHGGTLLCLVKTIQKYIMTGEPVYKEAFGPWPDSVCHGDLWGYGEDMHLVREAAHRLVCKVE